MLKAGCGHSSKKGHIYNFRKIKCTDPQCLSDLFLVLKCATFPTNVHIPSILVYVHIGSLFLKLKKSNKIEFGELKVRRLIYVDNSIKRDFMCTFERNMHTGLLSTIHNK